MRHALYGNISIPRGWCSSCQTYSLVVQQVHQCCGKEAHGAIAGIQRMTSPEDVRRCPRPKRRREVLEAQENRCAYCETQFGTLVNYKGRLRRLRIVWDHEVPWLWSQNNSDANFVAACQICNGIKEAKHFPDLDAARAEIRATFDPRGFCPVSARVHTIVEPGASWSVLGPFLKETDPHPDHLIPGRRRQPGSGCHVSDGRRRHRRSGCQRSTGRRRHA